MRNGALSTRRRSRRPARRWGRTKNFAKRFEMMSQAPVVSSIPLLLILLVTCLDFITFEYFLNDPEGLFSRRSIARIEDDFDRLRADALQKYVQSVAYVMAGVLAISHLPGVIRFFLRERGLLLIIFTILLTAAVSSYPTKVYTNAIHITMGVLAAFLFAYPLRHRKDFVCNILWIVLLSSCLVLSASLLTWGFLFEDPFAQYYSGNRYGGFVGNPNNMGWVCMLALWAGLGLATNRKLSLRPRLLAFSAAPLSLACAILADSTTTFVVLALIAALALVNFFLTAFKHKVQNALKAWCLFSVIIITPALLVYLPAFDSIMATGSESLTGDATFTGRSEIWELGRAAFFERPILGWSFDAHLTVSDSAYAIPYTQYHNGYIDTLVGGGAILFLGLLWQIGSTAARILSISRQNITVFPVVSFLAVVLVANISEHAILRIDNPIWETYVLCAVAIAVVHFSMREKNISISKSLRRPSKVSSKIDYRF